LKFQAVAEKTAKDAVGANLFCRTLYIGPINTEMGDHSQVPYWYAN